MVVAAVSTGVRGQSAAEKSALAKLGEGFIVYSEVKPGSQGWPYFTTSKIVRADIDGKGGYAKRVLADSAYFGSINFDGSLVGYMRTAGAPADHNAELWVMNADGSGERKISKSPVKNVSWLRMSASENKFGYCAGPEWKYGSAAGELRTMDMNGVETMLVDAKGPGTYDFIDFIDLSGDYVAYRFKGKDTYVYSISGKAASRVAQGCGVGLSRDAKKLALNQIGHTGFDLYLLQNGTFVKNSSHAQYSFKTTQYNFSNTDWVTSGAENGSGCYAQNVITDEKLRITFPDATAETHFAELFVGKPGQTGAISRSGALQIAAYAVAVPSRARYDLRGCVIPGNGIQVVRGHGVVVTKGMSNSGASLTVRTR